MIFSEKKPTTSVVGGISVSLFIKLLLKLFSMILMVVLIFLKSISKNVNQMGQPQMM